MFTLEQSFPLLLACIMVPAEEHDKVHL